MSEWDYEDQGTGTSGRAAGQPAGSWDAGMTAAALAAVTAVSFLTAWLTKDVPSRPFWMLGLCFAAPVVALLSSVFLKEKISSSMTPSTSRNAQMILIACSILAAAVVGCFCQVSNEQADKVEQIVVGEGWSDVLIILDKSGSMSEYTGKPGETLDSLATEAVTDLIGQMDDTTRVGLLIDVGWAENNELRWTVPLEKRLLAIQKLTPEHRKELTKMAQFSLGCNENFPRAFEVASEVVQGYDGRDGDLTIIVISDGQDITNQFRAANFADLFIERQVKVQYLYVAPGYSTEMSRLAEMTGGTSLYVNDRGTLVDQMKKMVSVSRPVTIYKDALRDIDESTRAKIVTGILLLLLGLLIGVSLTVMFSLQGQKRFQMILSPVMALLAFAILAFGKDLIAVPWIREGVAFSLFGIVLMRKNREAGKAVPRHPAAGAANSFPAETADADW